MAVRSDTNNMDRRLYNDANRGSHAGGHSSRNENWQTLYDWPNDMYDHGPAPHHPARRLTQHAAYSHANVPFRGMSRGSMRGRHGVGRGGYNPQTSVHRRPAPQQSSSDDESDHHDDSDNEDNEDGDSDDGDSDEEEEDDDDSNSDNGESASHWEKCVFPG